MPSIRVPAGATRLMFSPNDSCFGDNSDPNGNYRVLIETIDLARTRTRHPSPAWHRLHWSRSSSLASAETAAVATEGKQKSPKGQPPEGGSSPSGEGRAGPS